MSQPIMFVPPGPVPGALAGDAIPAQELAYTHGNTPILAGLNGASTNGNTVDFTNNGSRGVKLGINITALTGTGPTVTISIQGKDTASGQYYTIIASAALAATGFTVITIYPGVTVAANVAVSDVLPQIYRLSWAIAGTTPAATFTLGGCLIP